MEIEVEDFEKMLQNCSVALMGLQKMLGSYEGLSRSYRATRFHFESGDLLICLRALDTFLSDKDCAFDDRMLLPGLERTTVEKDVTKMTLSDGFSILSFNVSPRTVTSPVRLLKATRQSGLRWNALCDRIKTIKADSAKLRKEREAYEAPAAAAGEGKGD